MRSQEKRLVASLTPKNKAILDEEFVQLADRRKRLESRLGELKAMEHMEVDIDALADRIVATVSSLDDVFPYGTIDEQKELIGLFAEKIELDPDKRVGKVYMKRFPMPSNGTGESFGMVAGARYTHQKRNFPPIDVIDIQFEYQGSALVPAGV